MFKCFLIFEVSWLLSLEFKLSTHNQHPSDRYWTELVDTLGRNETKLGFELINYNQNQIIKHGCIELIQNVLLRELINEMQSS